MFCTEVEHLCGVYQDRGGSEHVHVPALPDSGAGKVQRDGLPPAGECLQPKDRTLLSVGGLGMVSS